MLIIVVLCACIICVGIIIGKTNETLTSKDKLVLQDFKIGGLYLEQPISEAIKILGKPTKVITIPNKDGVRKYDEEDYYFPGVIIRVHKSDKKAIQLRIENKNLKTYRGIKIGSKEEDIYNHYGKVEKADNELTYWMLKSQTLVSKHYVDTYYAISFVINNGKVSRIDFDYALSE
jgi:hypothetical protein